jgi:hypothetical protein
MKLEETQTLLWLTCVSTILSITIILVTLLVKLDLGGVSILLAPIAAFFTIAYHTTITIIACRRAFHPVNETNTVAGLVPAATMRSPARTKWSIGLACLLCLLWAAAIVLTIAVTILRGGPRGGDPSHFIPVGVSGSVLEFIELVVLIVFASVARLREPIGVRRFYL